MPAAYRTKHPSLYERMAIAMGDKMFGLLGRTLAHSFSPEIHRELGVSGYRLIELEPDRLDAFFSESDIGGINVTIPYKKTVIPYCATLSEQARETGSVNTIVQGPSGLHGHNTDAFGLSYMALRAGISFFGKKVLIFGSGGASQTAGYVAKKEGAREAVIISRKGRENYHNLERHSDAEILINATPVGMYPNAGQAAFDLAGFPRCEGVLDLIYNPLRTALLMQAQAQGIKNENGLSMLVAQAKAAAELFLKREIPDSELRRILKKLRAEKENIVLIGMPGSGKTTVGKALEELTGRELIDLDEEIIKCAGMSIPEIFEKLSEDAFRDMESEQAARCGCLNGKILVTGGGTVKREENFPLLRRNGRIYHIIRDIRLLSTQGRPLSKGADLEEMQKERLPMYIRFRDAETSNSGTPAQTAKAIWRDFCENTCD